MADSLPPKARAIRGMFDRIAGRYDLMNRLISFGQDVRWRRRLIRMADLRPGDSLLDIATGTGDFTVEALRQQPGLKDVVGADFSYGMLAAGRHKRPDPRIQWHHADALALPYPAASFEVVTSGYLLRNVLDIPSALREQFRVLRPGGVMLALDSSPPPRTIFRPFILFHLRVIIPLLGRLLAADPAAYVYLPESTQAFKTPDQLLAMLREAGFIEARAYNLMLGAMVIVTGRKP